MLMTKYALRKLGLRPAKGQKPFAYTGEGISLYEKEKAVPIKMRPNKRLERTLRAGGLKA